MCSHMINRHKKHAAGLFWTLSVLCLGKQHCQCTGVKQLFQPVTQTQIQAKRISPSCYHSSSKYGNVHKSPSQGEYNCMAERASVWEDKSCLCASRSVSLYSSPNHQRQLCMVADKKEVKLLKN